MTLHAEVAKADAGLSETIAASLQSRHQAERRGEAVAPGTLANDGKVIADERPIS